MTSRIRNYLTPQERLQCMKVGAYSAFARNGVRLSQIDPVMKQAGFELGLGPGNVTKAIIATSVLMGIPLGIAAHVVGKRITEARGREKELISQTGYYTNASQQLERGLAAANAST